MQAFGGKTKLLYWNWLPSPTTRQDRQGGIAGEPEAGASSVGLTWGFPIAGWAGQGKMPVLPHVCSAAPFLR